LAVSASCTSESSVLSPKLASQLSCTAPARPPAFHGWSSATLTSACWRISSVPEVG
jgi:hypothetical protein